MPLDLPDGRPPLAREFSEAQMIHRIVRLLKDNGGMLTIRYVPAEHPPSEPEAAAVAPPEQRVRLAVEPHWLVGAEYGTEAPDSPMAGAAIYGTGPTLRSALEQAGDDARLWRSDVKVAAEVEKEAHRG